MQIKAEKVSQLSLGTDSLIDPMISSLTLVLKYSRTFRVTL